MAHSGQLPGIGAVPEVLTGPEPWALRATSRARTLHRCRPYPNTTNLDPRPVMAQTTTTTTHFPKADHVMNPPERVETHVLQCLHHNIDAPRASPPQHSNVLSHRPPTPTKPHLRRMTAGGAGLGVPWLGGSPDCGVMGSLMDVAENRWVGRGYWISVPRWLVALQRRVMVHAAHS
ncbi:uncharacterized protein H6S33_007008 [Morchella sextelata]|uniref:uncharacterized protein n=1 Tax=Morchella sextelata TaxID=1174677 RepID=UPI001D05BD41|nr:uncharacterized protein H6S33_007008 [Morchella sextelata]KAH0603977.1 hypothetical protein H6S33_007008 [Morchella sextelata]